MMTSGSRRGSSFAVCSEIPDTRVNPTPGVTTNPDGENVPMVFPSRPPSKFRYFVVLLSMAFATPSEGGLFAELAKSTSPGWVTSCWAKADVAAAIPTDRKTAALRTLEALSIRLDSLVVEGTVAGYEISQGGVKIIVGKAQTARIYWAATS